jgi:DNA segregation ATPase FtsK/SpoIIIE-like protein
VTFDALLDQAVAMLKKHRRVSYRALQRQFQLEDDDLALLTEELSAIQRLAVD